MKVKDKKIKNKADFKDKTKILKINTEIKNRAVLKKGIKDKTKNLNIKQRI